ncbi:MAG: cation:proton antiporter [Deltaproteobacteria bacterium]|nr:cation:proton antiporter [Deltaproteobacteria bacterium]
MDIWYLIMEIVLLLGLAFLFGVVAQRLKQSAIVGYLLAGAVLGPILFNKAVVQEVAELGVALLLFSIGLEFSFGRLKRMGGKAFLIGILQILITLFVFALIFAILGPVQQALAMGAIIALSSTAIVLRVLVDRMEIDSIHGRNALAVLLTQDIAVVPLVLLVTILGHGGSVQQVIVHIFKTVAAAGGLAALFFGLFYIVIPKVLMTGNLFANRELVVLLSISAAIGSAWAAHAIGLSPALGAFIAGMLLAESPFATQIRSDIGSLRTLFVTLFFTSIGMLANPAWLIANLAEAVLWLVLVFLLKAGIIYFICMRFRMGHLSSLATGITLAQIGEFSFVLATVASRGGVLGQGQFDMIVTVTILSMFLAPYMAAYAHPLSGKVLSILKHQPPFKKKAEVSAATQPPASRIFIVGFGPAGQQVADVLLAEGFSAGVVELNPKTAAMARKKGLPVHMVDATNSEAISHTGIKGACLVVVTVPDPRSAQDIIKNLRLFAPGSIIVARSRYNIASQSLKDAGADAVVDEESTTGEKLAMEVMDATHTANRDALGCALAGEKP